MKYLLYKFTSSDSKDLNEQYIDFPKADRDNRFFNNLFKRQFKVS